MDDMLSSLLNDPEKLKSAISMASSMLGGSASGDGSPPVSPEQAASAAPVDDDAQPEFHGAAPLSARPVSAVYDPSADLMQKAMPVLAEIARSGQGAVSREKLNLLNAVKPFVADSVGAQIDHGLKLVSVARMARAALRQVSSSPAQEKDGVSHV